MTFKADASTKRLGFSPASRRRDGALPRQARSKRRRAIRIALWASLAVLLAAVGVSGWALNRFVFDHVEINDVNSYESEVKANTSDVPLASFSVPVSDPPNPPASRYLPPAQTP